MSVCVHALPSLQVAPLALFGLLHVPFAVSHVPASWHWSSALHTTGLLPVHVPVWQVSVCVQALPSLHVEPLVLFGLLQTPVAGAHVPTSWHWSSAAHVTGLLPVQVPVWQVSVCEHALPSSQLTPSFLFGLLHTPSAGLQVPASWHWSSAEQVTGEAPTHAPVWHVSTCVHALPSEQLAPSFLIGLEHVPSAGSQVPAVWH